MLVTIELPVEIQFKLEQLSISQNKTKSDIVRESLNLYFNNMRNLRSPFELGKDFFGKYGSEHGDLSVNAEKILRSKLSAKKHS